MSDPNQSINPPLGENLPPLSPIVSSPSPKKKFGTTKIIASILGLVVLIGGVGAGVFLTQQKQVPPKANVTLVCDDSSPKACCDLTGITDACGSPANQTTCSCSHDSCLNQGRSWCVSDYAGYQYTCCATGYICSSTGSGCVPGTSNPPSSPPLVEPTCTLDQPTSPIVIGTSTGIVGHGNADCGGDGHSCTEEFKSTGGSLGTDRFVENYVESDLSMSFTLDTTWIAPTTTGTYTVSFKVTDYLGGIVTCTKDIQVVTSASTPTPTPTGAGTPTPTPTPTATPSAPICSDIKTFDSNGTAIPRSELPNLTVGETVNFCVTGSAAAGSFDAAKFTINGTPLTQVTTKNSQGYFCQSYTISPTDTTVTVTGQVHHLPENAWY